MRSLTVILAAIFLMNLVRPAGATDIPYTFLPGAKALFADGNLEFITGSFIVTEDGEARSASILLSGTPPASGNPPEANLYNLFPTLINNRNLFVYDTTNTYQLVLFFNADLTIPGFRGVTSASWTPINNLGLLQEATTRGGACSPVPSACVNASISEPGSIVILILALGLFLVTYLVHWRNSSAA